MHGITTPGEIRVCCAHNTCDVKSHKKPLSLRKSIKTKLHLYFLIILVFGLSKMELSFITGCKGGCNAVYDGHVYTFDRKKDSGVMYWQCKGKRTLQCKARLYSRCLGGVEACYSSLQFNHRNQLDCFTC